MDSSKLVALVAVIALVYWGYRLAAPRCRRNPGLRPWLILGALCALAGAIALVPWSVRLKPPWSESPSGLFLIAVRFIPLAVIGLGAIGAILGAILPGSSDSPESPT